MSFITSPSTLVKGELGSVSFDKDAFLFQVTISDPYFANERNWKRVVLVFEDAAGKQKQYAILTDNWSRANFEPSETSRTGVWGLNEIHIYDHQQGLYIVPRADLPSPENFDVEATRIVAPSSTISSIESVSNLNSFSTFDVATVEDAGWTKTVNNSSDAVINAAQVVLQTDASALGTIKIEKSFPLLAGERYILEYNVAGRATGELSAATTVREPLSGEFFNLSTGTLVANGAGISQWYWEGVNVGGGALADGLTSYYSAPYTYYRGAFDSNDGAGFDQYAIYRVEDVAAVPGTINDIGVYARNFSNAIIQSAIHSAADGVQNFSFIAQGETRVTLESSGQAGSWTIDDIEIKKNPDAVTVPLSEVQYYKVGYKVKLWDVVANDFLTADVYTVTKVDVDMITLDQPIAGSYDGKTLLLKFPDYDNSSPAQKGLFQYVGKGY